MKRRHRRQLTALPFADWPTADRLAWSKLFVPSSPLDPDGPLSHWSACSQDIALHAYAHWLGFCVRRCRLLLKILPEARVQPEIVAQYLKELQTKVSPVTTMMRVNRLCSVIRAMAPGSDWEWLQALSRRLGNRATPIRRKDLRLRHPRELFDLGMQLMQQAESCGNAVMFRDGLIIALLAARPLRPRSLLSLELGHNLVRTGDGYRIALYPADTKTRRAFDISWPTTLSSALERYLTVYRPKLANHRTSESLWISAAGQPLGRSGLLTCVSARTRSAFGKSIPPYLFRDCVATAIASDDPEHVKIVAALLGHTSPRTGERHYIHAQSLSAGRKHQKIIGAIRRNKGVIRRSGFVAPADGIRAVKCLVRAASQTGYGR